MARRKPKVPKGLKEWPAHLDNMLIDNVVEMYNKGYAGIKYDPDSRDRFLSSQTFPDGEDVAYTFGLVGAGEGKISLPFLFAYEHWPKCWPCPGQTTGDCVSHGGKNAALVLLGVECGLGQPDPVTGFVEDFPEVAPESEEQGVIACEPLYGYRGHCGQGADCGRLQEYATSVGGIHLRKNYPGVVDLSRYNASIGINWCRSGPPAAVNDIGKQHQIRAATDCPNHEVVRDMHANGYSMWACSGLGWSSQRDENGYSRQQGGWSHSWITMAYDDRTVIKQKYGFPLALFLHDWGRWNSGGRDIYQSADLVPVGKKELWIKLGLVNPATGNIMIPEGTFWMDARLLNRCECTAMSNFNGFPRRPIDNMLI